MSWGCLWEEVNSQAHLLETRVLKLAGHWVARLPTVDPCSATCCSQGWASAI